MMPRRCKYTLFLSSLPRHPERLFSAKRIPISGSQLDRRLQLLEASDAVELQRIRTLARGSRFKDETEETVLLKYREMVDLIRDVEMRRLALWLLELRTLLSALRLRQAGAEAPKKKQYKGFGIWPDYIEKNWHQNDFGVGHHLPWLMESHALIAAGKPYELEKFLLELVWRHYAKAGSRHYFDFEAVAIYVLRWDLIRRWLNHHADQALERFDKLVEAGLKDCGLA
jgi:hypothetical protein